MSLPPNYNLLRQYPNPTYIETGVWRGDSIRSALDAGFDRIVAIDKDAECIDFCNRRFSEVEKTKIQFHRGDSAVCLHKILNKIRVDNWPITFFLDSHWQMFEGTEPGSNPFPLLKELEQIAMFGELAKDCAIIIDDMLIMQWNIVGYDLQIILAYLERINPNFVFEKIANPIINGILVAHP